MIDEETELEDLKWALNQQRMEYEEELMRLRKALEFYAVTDRGSLHHDSGNLARQVLKGE